jgi:hypothetical protein
MGVRCAWGVRTWTVSGRCSHPMCAHGCGVPSAYMNVAHAARMVYIECMHGMA